MVGIKKGGREGCRVLTLGLCELYSFKPDATVLHKFGNFFFFFFFLGLEKPIGTNFSKSKGRVCCSRPIGKEVFSLIKK